MYCCSRWRENCKKTVTSGRLWPGSWWLDKDKQGTGLTGKACMVTPPLVHPGGPFLKIAWNNFSYIKNLIQLLLFVLWSLRTNLSTQNVDACKKTTAENLLVLQFYNLAPAHFCIFSHFTITLMLIWLKCNNQMYFFRPYVRLADNWHWEDCKTQTAESIRDGAWGKSSSSPPFILLYLIIERFLRCS